MGDDRFCSLHISSSLAEWLLDEEDEKLGWDLPDDDIKVPAHLLPPYQDEDDETVLPSASHPSYPYGNPYAPSTHSTTTTNNPLSQSHSHSLATTLPVLSLRHLFTLTTFGESKERVWTELGLDDLLTDRNDEDLGANGGGDAPQPTGQNAGDFPAEPEQMELPNDDE